MLHGQLTEKTLEISYSYLSNAVGYRTLPTVVVVLRINVDLAIFQPYLDLEAGDNQSLKIQVARPGIEPRTSCSASQELNHSATAATNGILLIHYGVAFTKKK